MIYLIGGAPKCGKTTLAKYLSKELVVPWISADTIQNIVKIYTPESDYPEKFPSSNHRTNSNDERFAKYDSETLIEDYQKQAKTSYSAISIIVETYLVDEEDFIVEGYQITPELVNQLHEKFGGKNIKGLFLTKTDSEEFISNIHKTNTPNDWIIRRTKNKETFSKIAKMITEYSKSFEEEAKKYNLPLLSLDRDFEAQLKKAVKELSS